MGTINKQPTSVQEITRRLDVLYDRQKKRFKKGRTYAIRSLRERLATASIRSSTPVKLDHDNPNFTEDAFAHFAVSEGWSVSKKGWPDYLCWRGNDLMFVEVKKERQDLRPHQNVVLKKLAQYGLTCFVWSPITGFRKIS